MIGSQRGTTRADLEIFGGGLGARRLSDRLSPLVNRPGRAVHVAQAQNKESGEEHDPELSEGLSTNP